VVVAEAEGYRTVLREVELVADHEEVIVLSMPPARVKVTAQRIDIYDKVFFETAKTAIKPESFALLEEVADLILAHPELTIIRVEGHTDHRGSADYNRKLSDGRAAAVVDFITTKGVARERLQSVGYGEDKPSADGRSEDAMAANRRVEFYVVARSD
jgi:outer membrane protein OmpA-like peptidoglycan-associated protein